MSDVLLGLDIGTTKMCAVVGQVKDGDLQIIGLGIEESVGMKKGMVVDVASASRAIGAAISQAEQSSGFELTHVLISMAGEHLESTNSNGAIALYTDENGITQEDIERVLDASVAVAVPNGRQLLHVLPRRYQVDEQDGVINPLGMIGSRLGVDAHIITASTPALRNLSRCVEMQNLQTEAHILNIIASAEAVLDPAEKEMGVIVADIGGGTTDIAIFAEGAVWHTDVIAIGGRMFTSDIAQGLRVPFETAEQIKLQHGNCRPSRIDAETYFKVKPFNGKSFDAPLKELAFACEARAYDLFELIFESLKKSGYQGLVPAGMVLTGGGAQLRNLTAVSEEILNVPTRVARPRNITGLVDKLQGSQYATAIGLLQWGMRKENLYLPGEKRAELSPRQTRLFSRLKKPNLPIGSGNKRKWLRDVFLIEDDES